LQIETPPRVRKVVAAAAATRQPAWNSNYPNEMTTTSKTRTLFSFGEEEEEGRRKKPLWLMLKGKKWFLALEQVWNAIRTKYSQTRSFKTLG
jgi:hypothetical protein